jgi:hypothetical protein
VSRNIIAPSKSKAYVVVNESNAAVVIKGAATTGVSIAAGTKSIVAWNGSDFVVVATTDIANLSGTVPVNKGGTGQTSYTDGQLLVGNSTGNILTKATLTAGTGISVTNGAGSITLANTAPDQTVNLTAGSGINVTGTYPNFTVAATNAGTVTGVTGVSPIASSGGATPAISLTTGYGDTQNPYASKSANFFLAAPTGTAGVPTFRAIVATDIPTLNQNTTGTAGNVSGTVAVANGGTGQTSLTTNNVILGNGTSSVQLVAPGATGNLLTSNGATWVSQAPPSGMVYPSAGVAISTGTAWSASKTNPAGAFVGTTDAQTLTNKTITYADNTLTGVVGTTATQTLTNKTVTNIIFDGSYTEEVFAITDGATVNLDPNNGTIQTWTLGDDRTPDQANWAAGQSITLMVDDGATRTITWTTLAVVWETNGGTAPPLSTSGFTVIVLWKVGTTIYGARVGDN